MLWVIESACVLARSDAAARARHVQRATTFATVGLGIALQLPGCVGGALLNRWDVARAKAYCDALIPAIEAFHAAGGAYPAGLHELEIELESPPLLWRRSGHYASGTTPDDGPWYCFDFGDMFSAWYYSSQAGVWQHYD
jgi:hypothetical protein